MGQLISNAGFVNVTEKRFCMPVGTWPADKKMRLLGQWAQLSFEEGMEGFVMAVFSRVLGVSFSFKKTFTIFKGSQ
jgi:hypothetical protein